MLHCPQPLPPCRSARSRNAFSLVETVLAIAIVSFAMTGILGLIPVGLNLCRDAVSTSVESSIVQQLANEVLRTDFVNLNGQTASRVFYFDEQGTPAAAEIIYTAKVNPPQSLAPGGPVPAHAAVRAVVIEISSAANPGIVRSYPILVAAGM